MSIKSYIAQYSGPVIRGTRGTGLFPSVMMAQAILESGAGASSLSKPPYNNHFGIKADASWKGGHVYMPTKEEFNGTTVTIDQPFRTYKTAAASFRDRNEFLKKNPRYKTAGVFSAKTPQAQAEALQRAGYATASNYADTLKKIIADNNLEQLDAKQRRQTVLIVIGVVLIVVGIAWLIYNSSPRGKK